MLLNKPKISNADLVKCINPTVSRESTDKEVSFKWSQQLELELELELYLNTVNLSDKIIIRRKMAIYFNLYKHDLKI